MNDGEFFILLAMTVVGGILLFPLIRALSDRIRGGGGDDGSTVRAVAELKESVLDELQNVRRDVAELGERVDFAERLLAKQREAVERLGPPR